MPDRKPCFSELHIIRVAEKMQEISRDYEQLFIDFGSQLLSEIEELDNVSEIMDLCIERTEQTLATFQNHFPSSTVIACRKGCHHCCAFAIECPPLVVLDIAHHLKSTLSLEEQHLLCRKLEQNIAERKPPLHRAGCPFLDTDNSCSIYQKRPLACRSFSSPNAANCAQSVTDGRKISQHPIFHRLYSAVTTALLLYAEHRGQDHEQVPFIPALLAALTAENGDTQPPPDTGAK